MRWKQSKARWLVLPHIWQGKYCLGGGGVSGLEGSAVGRGGGDGGWYRGEKLGLCLGEKGGLWNWLWGEGWRYWLGGFAKNLGFLEVGIVGVWRSGAVSMESKGASFRCSGVLLILEQDFMTEEFRLKITKWCFSITKGESNDEGVESWIDAIDDEWNEIIIINGLTDCRKFVGPSLGLVEVFNTGLIPLLQAL
jgi:hypothetical protein